MNKVAKYKPESIGSFVLESDLAVVDSVKNGTVEQITFDEYRKIKRMNASTLVKSLKSMKALKRAIDEGFDEPTPAMNLGSSIHCLALEPDDYERMFCVMPDFENDADNLRKEKRKGEPIEDRRTNSKATAYYQQQVEKFRNDNKTRTIVTSEQYYNTLSAIEAINEHKEASAIIKSSQKEVTIQATISGVECKARIDLLSNGCIADIKTCGDCSIVPFGLGAQRLGYVFKLAFYREIVAQKFGEILPVKIIAQETCGDYDTVVYNVPDEDLRAKMNLVVEKLEQYKKCMNSGVWPGVDGGKSELELYVPNWAMENDDLEGFDE